MTLGAVTAALPDRACITVTGTDRDSFLQGLITQDIKLLDTQPLIYACFLTPQGKFLFDFFIRRDGDALLLDCEGGERAEALLKRLSMYKLRSDVTLELHDSIEVWQFFCHPERSEETHLKSFVVPPQEDTYPDPRHKDCGYRAYQRPKDIDEVPFEQWDEHRIRLEIPDGSRDLIPEKSFIHEGRLDELNAVSYSKGCYVGQELVSRMHHRGLTKKILQCIDINAPPDRAELRSACNNVGLALVRL